MDKNMWNDYLQHRLNSIEDTIKFILSSFVILLGLLTVQGFKVMDEDIFPGIIQGNLEFIDLLRIISLITGIIIFTVIIVMIFSTMNKRRKNIRGKIKALFFEEKEFDIRRKWKEIEIVDNYNNIKEFLFKKV
jgi:hypothetical protein